MKLVHIIQNIIRPICPHCDGTGGSNNYCNDYYGDWSGCSCCNSNEDREEPIIRIWFWQVWLYEYELWKLDRWVTRQVEKDKLSE
jgi:hypothetical protein